MAREARTGLGFADRLVLLMAWIATCGLVYLLGFYVGKGTQEHRLGVEEQIVRLPVTSRPPPEGQRAKTENEFGFYEKLMGDHPSADAAAPRPATEERAPAPPAPTPIPAVKTVATAVPPSPPAATPPKTSVAAVAPAKLPPPTAVATAVPPPARAPVAVAPPPAKPQTPPHPAADVAPGPAVAPHPTPATVVAAHPAAPAALTPPPHAAAAGAWTVLANPTQNRDEADALTRQLRGRGYDATLVRVVRDGGTWYRVQVGRFATSDQASETMHRLREHEGVTHAFVASE
jgi:hypothetical protein